ncbi:MAG: DNA-processing protein DprA, partial [Firmicutes bacterium]|nr:DNA-processing protein DprA [Bacillota bacterium]
MKDDKEKQLYDLWLDSLWEFAPRNKHLLIEKYGDSRKVYEQGMDDIREGMKTGIQENDRIRTLEEIEGMMIKMKEADISALAWDDEGFPESLRWIHHPPWMLYFYGRKELLKERCVAVVGARKASDYGKAVAQSLGHRIAATGTVVVSGMAGGVDSWAHRGALDQAACCDRANTIA